ncbi:MAG: caspase family protein [Planctomycetota bacterium]
MRHSIKALGFAIGLLLALPSIAAADDWGFGFSFGDDDRRERRDRFEDPRGTCHGRGEPPHCPDETRDGFGFGVRFGPSEPGSRTFDSFDDGREGTFFFPEGAREVVYPDDPTLQAPDGWPPTYDNVDDAKKVKRAVKKALLVGVGHFKGDEAISAESAKAMSTALQGGWGFAKRDIKTLVNADGTKENILSELDTLAADAKAASPDVIEAYFVVVYLQGHSTQRGDPTKMTDGVPGASQPKGEKVPVAYWARDAATDKSPTGLLFNFELHGKLDAISQALAKLEKAGVKTGLIVQADVCWAERYFDGWRGADGKGSLPANVLAAWAADRHHVSTATNVEGVEQPTPWARGFADALGVDFAGTGAQLHPSVQDAHQDAGDATNRARKRDVAKNPGLVDKDGNKADPTQGSGHAEPKGSAPLRPSDYPTGKPM